MKTIITIFALLLFACNDEKMINIQLGSEYNGGTVFYIFKENDLFFKKGEIHGLIAYPKDTVSIWGDQAIGGNGIDNRIGGGYTANEEIIDKCSISAAAVCYSIGKDWYLPNQAEFRELAKVRHLIPNLKKEYYWTSYFMDFKDRQAMILEPYSLNYKREPIYKKHLVRPIKRF